MIKRSFSLVWVGLSATLVIAGCAQQQRQEDELAVEPNIAGIAVKADYASGALTATGGLQRWAQTKKLQMDCVVTFYQPDGSLYLTEHHLDVYPWSNAIRVSAREPLGSLAWQLSGGRFSMLQQDRRVDLSRLVVSPRDYAEAVLALTTAPVRLVDGNFAFVKAPEPVRMEGLWYQPIERVHSFQQQGPPAQSRDRQAAVVKPYWSKVVYYQNRDSPAAGEQGSLVDLIWLTDVERGEFLLVRGYDYKRVLSQAEPDVQKTGVLLPTKIEIFRTDARAVSRERLVKIDLK